IRGTKVSYTVLDKTMSATKRLVEKGELDKLTVIDNYLDFMDNLSTQLDYYRAKKKSSKNDKKISALKITKSNIENNFIAAGVADCNTLIEIFTPKFEANSGDIKLVNKIIKLLNRQDCVDSDLYAKLAEKKFELEPNADAAHNMARFFIKKKEFDKSKEYLNKAIELEEDANKKASLHYKLANILLMEGHLSESKQKGLLGS
uniref:Tetratricopeptide repeat protein n=1 Tax=Setaria digitata TaxID=48799 RepID=A0A915PIN7_9BILA